MTKREANLTGHVLITYGAKALSILFTAGATVVVARELGPSGRGSVAVALALMLLLVQIGTAGVVSANPYFAARDPRRAPSLIANSLWLAVTLGVLLFATGLAIGELIPSTVEGLTTEELAVAVAAIPGALGAFFLQSILLGQTRMVAYNVVELGQNALMLAVLFVGLAWLDFGVLGVLATISGAYYLAVTAYLVLLGTRTRIRLAPDAELARKMVAYGVRIYVATLLAFMVVRLDMLLVNAYLDSSDAGIYSVAVAIAEAVYLLPIVVGLNLFPRVAKGAPTEQSAAVFRTTAVVFGAVCLVSAALAAPGIELLFGSEYEDATELYYWLLPGIFSFGMISILAHHFSGRGFPLEAMLVWIPGLALNVLMNVLLLEEHGVYIAALSTSLAYFLILVLHMAMFARETGSYSALVPRPVEAVRLVGEAARSLR